MSSLEPFGDPIAPASTPAQSLVRLLLPAAQVLGMGLIVLGAWYAVSVILLGLQFARQPADLEARIVQMARTLDIEGAKIALGGEKVAVGRYAAGTMLLFWTLVSAWVAVRVIAAGGQLVLGIVGERREFYAAMKEFMLAARAQDVEAARKSADRQP